MSTHVRLPRKVYPLCCFLRTIYQDDQGNWSNSKGQAVSMMQIYCMTKGACESSDPSVVAGGNLTTIPRSVRLAIEKKFDTMEDITSAQIFLV